MMLPLSIWLLDKVDPPAHSFVDGMLADALPATGRTRVILLVTRSRGGRSKPYRYGRAICIPGLMPRRHLARFINFALAWRLLARLRRHASRRGRQAAWFVRNEPIYLAAAVCARPANVPVIYQQSYPHEQFGSHALKRGVARLILRVCGRRIDGLLAVSPTGLDRLRRLFPPHLPGAFIPLLASQSAPMHATGHPLPDRPREFVYIGTHASDRRLEVVLQGVVLAIERGVDARVTLIGGHPQDWSRLRAVPGVVDLERRDCIRFVPPLSRDELLRRLPRYHAGLSLIPAEGIFRELSPTKLAEYLGAGLSVLASRGIPLQERFVTESGAGELVDFDAASIAEGVARMAAESADRHAQRRLSAFSYAAHQLSYRQHTKTLLTWIGR